jgi:hypothetical protein
VLQLLREAAKALKRGLLTEDQLVKLLQQEVKVRRTPGQALRGGLLSCRW